MDRTRRYLLAASMSFCLLALGTIGCSGGRNSGNPVAGPSADPLLGGPPIPRNGLFDRTGNPTARGPTSPLPLPDGPTNPRGPAALVGSQPPYPRDYANTPGTPTAWPSEGRGVVPAGATQPRDYAQLTRQLNEHGVTWRDLKRGEDGQWKFSCVVPDRSNPNRQRKYEATSSDEAGLDAMAAVLDKIAEERR